MTINNAKIKKFDSALKTIGEVASIIDVAPYVIRFWENKFPIIKPLKSKGRRYFDQQNIDKIIQIKKLLYSEGYSIKLVQNYFNKTEDMKEDNKKNNKKNNDQYQDKLIKIKERLTELRDRLLSLN